MEEKEITLSLIAEILDNDGFMGVNDSTFEKILKGIDSVNYMKIFR